MAAASYAGTMLLRADRHEILCIGQPAHAWVSGQLARAWGNERFGPVVPREEVCLGAEQHDVGMASADLVPTLNPDTGLPRSFVEWPLAEKLAMWRRAPDLLLPQSRYAALLTSLHGHALYAREDPATRGAEIDAFLVAEEERQAELLASTGADPLRVARNQRLLWTWDSLSLALCLDWAPHTLRDVPSAGDPVDVDVAPAGERRVALHPWPFAANEVSVHTEGRLLTGRFASADELRSAWAAAPWVSLEIALAPG
ncbi:MAG: hypothetical protein JWN32_3927 [Solirubrobacterales bacterium]|jgi:hypothetical protein|nr:hypothetical protein [Solirubrobacterales bacterium]